MFAVVLFCHLYAAFQTDVTDLPTATDESATSPSSNGTCNSGPMSRFEIIERLVQTWYQCKKPHVSRTQANCYNERIVDAINILPDIVDFSSISRFKRSIHNVTFPDILSVSKVFCDVVYILYMRYVLCIFSVFSFFFLKATVRVCLSLLCLVQSPCL